MSPSPAHPTQRKHSVAARFADSRVSRRRLMCRSPSRRNECEPQNAHSERGDRARLGDHDRHCRIRCLNGAVAAENNDAATVVAGA